MNNDWTAADGGGDSADRLARRITRNDRGEEARNTVAAVVY